MDSSIFCTRVKERRISLGLTGYKFAEMLDMNPSNMYRLEHGMFPRDERKLVAIADVLGVSLDYLFGRTDNPTPLGK